ncbi:CWF19-like protein 2 homolog [Leptidea sinapis]|uniref:CWF19-like protein 2 homolog n=1 Tax=Leptidea sinapis TaxID=189913 RepID=UPI0021260743|nr:CWF19-like protein 2 homolog [Leptidea sinapis]
MKEKRHKKHKDKKMKKKTYRSSDSNSSNDEWVEKSVKSEGQSTQSHEQWMSMSGILKTYTKNDIKPKREEPKKHNIDSYNPSTSSRELNPYWKDGGSGLPQTPNEFRKSKTFKKPTDSDDAFFSRKIRLDDNLSKKVESKDDYNRSYNWKNSKSEPNKHVDNVRKDTAKEKNCTNDSSPKIDAEEGMYLSDEKMNKLAAKIVKAEIIGDNQLVEKLKAKLEAAREYRRSNPEDDGILLLSTNSSGNSRPLTKGENVGDHRSKSNKRKASTHDATGRLKYFGNDDKYNLAQMFEEEKYGSNYDPQAELAKVASKHKNPNDDLDDIFMDEISKPSNAAKDSEKEKQQAINQSVKLEKSLEGCEHCLDSKNMIKHLMVSCGNKVYMALPAKKSLLKGHCILTTIQHHTCVTALDEDVWEEIMNYRKKITLFFNSQNKDVVFYETATRLHRYPHLIINCVPLPRDVGDMASIYFKKALLDCEAEWSMNKKVVDLKGKNIRKCVPKGLPYFWIDFGMDPGFAHVIEDQQLFPKTFAEEIIGGMLDLDHTIWNNPQREYGDLQRKKVVEFVNDWKPFEKNF